VQLGKNLGAWNKFAARGIINVISAVLFLLFWREQSMDKFTQGAYDFILRGLGTAVKEG
jgi:hypothetical protein